VDPSFDRFFDGDPAFFTNIHPNSTCMGLIADWEIEKLKELWSRDRYFIPMREMAIDRNNAYGGRVKLF